MSDPRRCDRPECLSWNPCPHRPRERTPAEEAVIRAAVAWQGTEPGSDAEFGSGNELHAAVDTLLAVQPKWKP